MWVIQVALAACLLAPSAAYFFESGYSHRYTYWAQNTLQDEHNITTVLKFEVSAVNETEEGHRLHSLTVHSLVQYVKDGMLMNNPLKWNLSKTFLFVSDDKGSVRLVHCHPEDHEELLVIKKAMVSVFSVHVQIEEDKEEWTYSVDERDHLGDLRHDYRAQRTSSGLKLHRKHASSREAFREHEKTLHYDDKGTLRTAEATDRVWVKDRSPKTAQSRLPGEKPHPVVTSGDFPVISSSAKVKVSLDGKRLKHPMRDTFQNLTVQTLQTAQKPSPKYNWSSVEKNITRVFQCLRQFPDKENENRSMCVNDLRRLLVNLHDNDLKSLVDRIIGNSCPGNDMACEDQRLIVIDIIARIGDVTSQELLMTHVLTKKTPVDEELRRVFMHCPALEHPTEAFIQAIERFCFGPDGEHHGSRAMNRTQSRACLAVGSLAGNSHTAGQPQSADRLVDRLETWLDQHGRGDPHISKRDTWMEETIHEDHHISKAVLLHALGNAAMSRSRRHLMLHATSNRGHQLWRRAALDAMRRYNCTETAKVMLDCLMHDDKHTVRRMALNVYVKHPRRYDVSKDHENTLLSEHYTYPAVARVKRDLFEKVLLKFKIELPKLDWKKEVGNRAVGASFGVFFENKIDALFKVLSGYVDVNVHDKVWAEIHLGVINRQWYLLDAEICYKGRLSYNMNLVKDFTVGIYSDLTSAFDHIANQIMEPMEKTANELASKYQNVSSKQPVSGFEPLSTAVKELPKTTERSVQATVNLTEVAESLGGLPLVTKLQQLATRAQSLMEDVHNEATDLFANMKDAAVVALPFGEKEIRQALNTVLSKMDDVTDHPRQVFSSIERAKMGYTLAMQRILEGHNILKQATSFLSGSKSNFMNAAHELEDIAATSRLLVQRLRAHVSRRRRDTTSTFELDEFGQNVALEEDEALDELCSKGDIMADAIIDAIGNARAVQEGLDKEAFYVDVLKHSYQGFKEAIDMIKSRINALFGQKFHPRFPQQRRDCDDKCGCGYFPTDCTRYGHPGVELKWDPDWKIVSPVAGVATLVDENTISIKPYTAGFTDYEIILSNIISLNVTSNSTFVDAGQVIGTPVGENGCDDSHFHLSMKRAPQDAAGSGGLCYYVDPSPFLDHMQPVPKWQPECKDFTFKHIGNVIDFSKLTEGFAKVLLHELERVALDVGKQLVMKVVDHLPDTGILGTMKGIASDIVDNIDLDAGNLKNLVKDAVKSNMKGFILNIATKHFNVNRIMAMAAKVAGSNQFLNRSIHKVTGLISKAQNLIRNPPLGILKSLPTGAIGRLLTSRGVLSALPAGLGGVVANVLGGSGAESGDGGNGPDWDSGPSQGQGCVDSALGSLADSGVDKMESLLVNEAGQLGSAYGPEGSAQLLAGVTSEVTSYVTGRTSMMTALKTSVCKMCASLGSALSRLTHSACMAHEDCLGIDCHVTVNKGILKGTLEFSLNVYPEEKKLVFTVDHEKKNVTGSENSTKSDTVPTRLKLFRHFDVSFKVSATWQASQLHLHLGAVVCYRAFCLPEVPIVKDLKFGGHRRPRRSAEELLGPFLGQMDSLPVDDVTKMFSDFSLPMEDMVNQVTGIQEQISSNLSPQEEQADSTMEEEFKDPVDHKDKGQFPLQGQNSEVYIPFFEFIFIYQLGPLRFTMEFDAGGAIGFSFDVQVQALDSLLKTVVKPWLSGKFHVHFSASIVIASCGIDLTGWVLKSGFPVTLQTNYSKQPVITTKTLALELIPVELKLTGYVKIFWVINVHKTIWHYTAPAVGGIIWSKEHRKDDLGPPRFPSCNAVAEQCAPTATTRISATSTTSDPPPPGCSVTQVSGRHPKDPAFLLQFSVNDDDSDLKLFYAVGDYPGGTNVLGWTTMRGNTLLAPAELPCGIPLYFLVKARNSQGLETTAKCSLPTFDCTFPDGRVDAAFRCSSHPSKLSARVILFEDSKLKEEKLFHGVGYSPSSHGHEVVHWHPLNVFNSRPQPGVSGDLSHFSSPRPGRLNATPKRTSRTSSAALCASACLALKTCVSFSYQQYLHDCELQELTEGASAERKPAANFMTYERLGTSYTALLRYENLPLRHGTRYYVNADVENELGYRAVLTSRGTMIDMTSPEPGPVGEKISDSFTAGGCQESILQRCEDHVPGFLNHRRIVDGPGSRTVFTGNRKGQEMPFTMENYHAAANWDGFKDEECGIHGYTWAVGTTVCGTDVASFTDPHASIHNPDDWTYTGLARDLHLEDGNYYVTVQAISDIIHGGDLVTTVCHSAPFVVDTTPPDFNAVEEFLFDDSFRFLVVYYNVSDHVSGVERIEFGLGKTKYDVMIRPYLPFEMRGVEGNTYIVNEEFETEDGVPAWIRLKVVNNVGLSATGSSESPVLLDSTPPIAGHVMDGSKLGQDVCCQMSTTEICAQWEDFYDPDSNIDSYDWGVGLTPGKDDVVKFHTLSSYDKESCVKVNVSLQHNVTYFSTVVASNKALNTKSANTSSDGILIDVTPPTSGKVADGSDVNNDVNYTSETATVTTSWVNFSDPESGLADYSLSVFVNGDLEKTFPSISETLEVFSDHSLSLQHGDSLFVELQANNRAGGKVTVQTDGMLVDHTPPQLVELGSESQSRYQQNADALDFVWEFQDPESGIEEYRCVVYQQHHGTRMKFRPESLDYYVYQLNMTSPTVEHLNLRNLSLQNGASYSVKVTAMNRAKMATSEESEAITVDTTPPDVLNVILARQGEEEEINGDEVELVDREPLWVTWSPLDSESGIEKTQLCVGLDGFPACPSSPLHLQTVDGSLPSSVSVRDVNFTVSSDEKKTLYRVYLVVYNKAGLQSSVVMSKPFLVLKADVPGVVLDGRGTEDADFSHDKASIAITFSGFSSEACGIAGYEWGVGTSPFATDVLPYTDYGLVVDEAGNGFAQVHIMQFEGQKYYSTVRAKTGHNCHEEYIVSSSNGFTVDTTPPEVSFRIGGRQVTSQEVVYQNTGDHLAVLWRVEDASGVNDSQLNTDVFGSNSKPSHVDASPTELLPLLHRPSSGDSVFSAISMTDNAGNEKTSFLPLVTFDFTPPAFKELACTSVVSLHSSLLSCSWATLDESHSALTGIQIGLGSGPSLADLMNMTSVPIYSLRWSVNVNDVIESYDFPVFYVIVRAENAAGLKTEIPVNVTIDNSPPTVDAVRIVTSPRPGFHDVEQVCQTSDDYIEVLVTEPSDIESDIKSIELALGSSKGRSDVKAFSQYPLVDGLYILGRLGLSRGATVYVTARITNTVGLYIIAMSQGVVISPEPRLEVKDGAGDTDLDGQMELHVLQGSWTYSDSCPVLRAEWSVQELGGKVITNFSRIPNEAREFYNDSMHLQNFKTYVNYVRIVDALGRTRTAYSDGVTILIRRPNTATIRDGLADNDVDFQEPTDTLSANWDSFGEARSTLPSDKIIRYEAAVGTDRMFFASRSDVHAFEDVGLATNVTFYGLNLTAKTQIYYVTVRAYSAAGSYAESSSDGISVGFSGDVTAGFVDVAKYQSSVSSVRFAWANFDSDMTITHYYGGISAKPPPWDNSTYDCSELLQDSSFDFDIYRLQPLSEESMAVITGLSLKHGDVFHVTVVAVDKMSHCSAVVSRPVLVDTTPPLQGSITVEGKDAGTVIFIHSPHTVLVDLKEFPDPESGVQSVKVDLVSSEACSVENSGDSLQVIASVDAKNQSVVTLRNLRLQENILYFIRVTVTNGADLETQSVSRPVLLDTSPPVPGVVKLGGNWTTKEQAFRHQTDSVDSVVALWPLGLSHDCVTQIDLLAEETSAGWNIKEGSFAPNCVGFDESGLHVIVRHNPYLTGMERGAVQYSPLAWREGDYKFRISPAVEKHLLAGVSLASYFLQPPFFTQNEILPGNQSTLPCDSSVRVCMEDRNQNTSQSSMLSDTDYGTGLTFMEVDGKVKLLFWAQDIIQLKHSWIPLDFDPVATTADYVLNLQKRTDTGSELWAVTVLVNGQSRASVSGLIFPGEFVLSVYGWNIDDYFPPVTDIFSPFRADTVLHSVSLPVAQRPLCSYGNAFSDAISGVKEVWMGVSDDYNGTANMAPFTLLKSFCLPCLLGCDNICSMCHQQESLSEDFTILPLKLNHLLLQAADKILANSSLNSNDTTPDNSTSSNSTAEELSRYDLPTYYLDVRVVDHSGLATEVKSKGLVVDTSPPFIKSLRCFDPHYFKDVEVLFLGNNRTVGAMWDVSEDVSGVKEIWISLGTQPGLDDTARKVQLNKTRNDYTFANITPPLKEDGVYYATVEAVNEAGLSSQGWRNFTVHTAPPDISVLSVNVPGVNVRTFGGVDVGLMENSDNLELDLDIDPALADELDVEYYEWAIGTTKDKDDVFPRTVVGGKHAKKVAITNGYVHRDETPAKISVGDYAKQNHSTDDLPDPSANKFKMEPGRCLTQRLYGVSKSHVSTSFDVKPMCIKRASDVIKEADGNIHVLQHSGSTFSVDPSSEDADALTVRFKMNKGALIAGVLSDPDLAAIYDTSASAEFSPFIVQPDTNLDLASRWLKKRLVKAPGPSIFLSPVAEAEFADDVTVEYKVPSTVQVSTDSVVSLLAWNPDVREWQAPEEVCTSTSQNYNPTTRVASAKFCAEMFMGPNPNTTSSATRRKRSSSSSGAAAGTVNTALGPRMVTVIVVNTTIQNLPPIIHNTSLTLLEDGGAASISLSYGDQEGDSVVFWLDRSPAHGQANVTPDGLVTYRPQPNYSGLDVIYIKGREVLDPSARALRMVPNVVSFSLTVSVTDLNDPPDIFYLPAANDSTVTQQLMVGPTAGNGVNMTVYIEGNTTTHAELGLVVFSDIDQNDTVNFGSFPNVSAGAKFEEKDVQRHDPRLHGVSGSGQTKDVRGKDIALDLPEGFAGHLTYYARASDTAGAFSLLLTLNVFALISPCDHGDCHPRDQQGLACLDPQRAFSFHPYVCHCDLGYEGEWCQTETDECQSATCSPITDCVDLIGEYRCDVNPIKLAAIILCCVVAVVLVIFAVYKLKKRPSKVDAWKGTDDFEFTKDQPSVNPVTSQQSTSESGTEGQSADTGVPFNNTSSQETAPESGTAAAPTATSLTHNKTLPPIGPWFNSPYSMPASRRLGKGTKLAPIRGKGKKPAKEGRQPRNSPQLQDP